MSAPFISALGILKMTETKTLALDDQILSRIAERLAFYYATLDAVRDFPLDDPMAQSELIAHLESQVKMLAQQYRDRSAEVGI